MHIVFDARMINNSGVGRIVQNFGAFLPDTNDLFVTILTNEVLHSSFCKKENLKIKKLIKRIPIYSVLEQFLLPFEISCLKPDLVHFPNFNFPIMERHPFIVTINDLIYYLFPDSCPSRLGHLYAKFLIIRAAFQARRVVTISNYTKSDLIKHLRIPEDKISVIYPGVDTDTYKSKEDLNKFKICKNMYGIERKYIFYAGNHEKRKNLVRLIEAFSRLKNRVNYQLVLAGKIDDRRNMLYRYVREKDLSKDVIFTGLVPEEDLVLLYNMAELFVFPSLYEGFGLPPLEAMACMTPVVCSNTTSLPEVVGDAAVLFDPLSVEDIKNSIEKVLFDDTLKKLLIEKSKKRVAKFQWNKTLSSLLELYRDA